MTFRDNEDGPLFRESNHNDSDKDDNSSDSDSLFASLPRVFIWDRINQRKHQNRLKNIQISK